MKSNKEWQKSHQPKTQSLIARVKKSTSGIKDGAWYLDSAVSIHTTYHLKDYIHLNLDNSQEDIEIANSKVLYTKKAGTIAIEIVINNIPFFVHIHNVDYCSKIDTNLLLLEILTSKDFEFHTRKKVLNVINAARNTVLQSRYKSQIYPLAQLHILYDGYISATVHAYKAIRPQTQDLWHQRADM